MQRANWSVTKRLGAAFGLVLIYGGLAALGAWHWSGAVRELVDRWKRGPVAPAVGRSHDAELADLTAPVQRYLRAVLTDDRPVVTAITLTDLHPDDATAEARFKDISAAYDLVKDPATRARFDAGGIDASGAEKPPRQ